MKKAGFWKLLTMALFLLLITTMKVKAEETDPCLTFTGTTEFTIEAKKYWNGTMEYSTDTENWTTWDGAEIKSNNKVLYIRGSGNTIVTGAFFEGWSSESPGWKISAKDTGTIACSGDIRTLLDYTDPKNTTMGRGCFANMFIDCTGLTKTPALPAETLADYCYISMFSGCTGLTEAPVLPAETLADYCYASMFEGCIELKTVPALPAETLADCCYTSTTF